MVLLQYHSPNAATAQKNFHVWNSSFELVPKPFLGLLSVVDNLYTLWVFFLEGVFRGRFGK